MDLSPQQRVPREITPPLTGAVIEWRKSGEVRAVATLPAGERIEIACYNSAADEIDGPEAKIVYACTGFGAAWVSREALVRIARDELASILAARKQAEIDADDVIEYARPGTRLNMTYAEKEAAGYGPYDTWIDPLLDAQEELPGRRGDFRRVPSAEEDGWVRFYSSTCYPIDQMRKWGDTGLSLALLARGLMVVFSENASAWRLCDVETGTKALLADGIIELLWGAAVIGENSYLNRDRYPGQGETAVYQGLRTMRLALDRVVDTIAQRNETWARIVQDLGPS